MNKALLDLYSDYLLSSFSLATATGLASLVDQAYSHDQITRFLDQPRYDQKEYWQIIKRVVRQVERDDAAVLVDDTIEEKPYTDESELVCYHYDHTQGRSVKGINLLNFVYHVSVPSGETVSIPVSYEVVTKPEVFQDPKTGKYKRRSEISKNELVRQRLKILSQINQLVRVGDGLNPVVQVLQPVDELAAGHQFFVQDKRQRLSHKPRLVGTPRKCKNNSITGPGRAR